MQLTNDGRELQEDFVACTKNGERRFANLLFQYKYETALIIFVSVITSGYHNYYGGNSNRNAING